jgi:hypothetical protein
MHGVCFASKPTRSAAHSSCTTRSRWYVDICMVPLALYAIRTPDLPPWLRTGVSSALVDFSNADATSEQEQLISRRTIDIIT